MWTERLRAFVLARIDARCERAVMARKRSLLGGLNGDVLELGPGPGVSFAYYGRSIRWTGIEPDASCHARLRSAAAAQGIRVIEVLGGGAAFPHADAAFDAVVSMFALCTVPDPATTLAEVLRVLRPGGRFVFLEHVGACPGTLQRRTQQLVQPAWARFANGCRLTRDTLPIIQAAGFATVEAEAFSIGVPLLSPHIGGIARRGMQAHARSSG